MASFYPLQWISERVVGDLGSVSSLTPAGAEPHDYELTPRDVATVADADAVVYLSDLQSSVDDAVAQRSAEGVFDAAGSADLDLRYEGHEHGEEEHGEEEHGEGVVDPHFWLDPQRVADVADALAASLAEVDPAGADTFAANAASVRDDLEQLDQEFRDGLAECASRDLVTGHSAFGYLARAYDLTQVAINGLAPDEEPGPGALTSTADFVRDHGVRTIYYETLVSPAVAETVARETGAQTQLLDPVEGLTDESAGDDYLSVMRANLASLRSGQGCS
ncbi:zinc ABC transporter substrate-binding protein [Klenkia sp. LSe6-5]|uniref:Zinc ABC transporter substrate-binding protein n=1 Tax=Klenkia sesuvii TaxID=3103137 RepID=A0ABU8DSN0_9ACTN